MTDSTKSTFKAFLRGVSGLLFGIGGISFLFGGRVIREFTKADLVLSEMAGMFIALVCLGLGALAKSAGEEDVSEEEGQSS
jgi:NADH:ubiquinone oxidoreductase subunit 5 (subunit L)/multisubunit Na+/H+ antiporter MnhA subunit